MPFEASQAIFRSLSNRILFVQNVVYKSSTRLAFVPDAKLQLLKFGHAQKESFAAPSSFTFRFLSSLLLLLFFPLFSFVGHLLGFLLVGKGFAKRSRTVNFFF